MSEAAARDMGWGGCREIQRGGEAGREDGSEGKQETSKIRV